MRFPLILPYLQTTFIARFEVVWALFEMGFQLGFYQYLATFERAGDIGVHALADVLESFFVLHAVKVQVVLTFNLLVDLAPAFLVLANEPFLIQSFFDEPMDI